MHMRSRLLSLLAALVTSTAVAGLAVADRNDKEDRGKGRSYAIGLWGDMPYSDLQETTGVPNLVADMNRQDLDLTAHVGDIKSGGSRCDNDVYSQAEGYFNTLEAPALYTPGDNEWTDCDRPSNGPYSSRERLAYIRNTMFDNRTSFGQRKIRLETQAAPRAAYTENRRWQKGGIVFATLHVVGSDNNLNDVDPDPPEYAERDAATNRWMQETFDIAERTRARGVLLITQANPGFDRADPMRSPPRDPRTLKADFTTPSPQAGEGFENFLLQLRERTIRFRRPVVLAHGDSHYFRLDKPLLDRQGVRLQNFTRLETPGNNPQTANNDVQWVKVRVRPESREVFSYEPQVVQANRAAVLTP